MNSIQPPPVTPSNASSRSNSSSRRRRDLTLPIPPQVTSLAVPLPLLPLSTSQHSNNSVGILHQNVLLSNPERVNRIGSGAGGTVYKVIHRPSGRLYALKVIFGHPEESVRRKIFREIEILRDVNDPNVVKCLEMDDRNGEIQLLLELMDGGSLQGALIQNEQQLSKLTFQILSGLAYLHRRRIVHRDIKPSNVLVNSQNKVKIADFGVSRVLEQTMDPCNSSVGTIEYMSPERINTDMNHGKYDGYAGDIWSFGVTVLEFYLGRFPFAVGRQGDWASLMCAISMSDPPQVPTTASLEFRDFIGRCLQRDPTKRWTATQLLRHPFILLHNQVQLPDEFRTPEWVETIGKLHPPPRVINPPPAVVSPRVKLQRPSPLMVNRDRFIVSEPNQFPLSHQPDAVEAETRKRPHKISRLTMPSPTHVTAHPSNFQQITGFRPGPVDISQPVMLDPLSSGSADSDRGGAADAGESMEYHHVESIDIPGNATESSGGKCNPLTGVERKVEEVENLLQVGVSDIRTVGIYGTGGIGKTSLAKLVFDRISTHFEGCSFLQDTRETTRQFGGLEILQTKLMSEILRRECVEIGSSEEGICYIKEVLCDMRVLVVIDNVDSGFCLDRLVGDVDSFGPGSRIIVIARSKTDLPKCTETYEVLKMNDQEAFTLFTTHAFKDSTSSCCRVNLWDVNPVLSQKILCAIGRIPLAVQVIGSLLSGEPVDEWGSTLEKLEDFPDEELQRRLKLSYDALSDQQKKIFLDVACFVNGEDSRISSYMWRESEGDTVLSEGLKGLVSLSLVKIGDNHELLMHDELRELGRELVCQEELSGTEKMNRFLIQVTDFAALLAEKDLERVEALSLCFDKRSQFQDSDFRKMPSLRFLKVADADMCGDFSDVFTNLRWLHWEGCPKTLKATNFYLKSLIILNLSRSKVTSIWEGWGQIKATNSLKVLNLTGCMNLITTPNLSNLPNLERLILEQCSSLVSIDPSIQCLEKLQFLNLKFCTELNMLPKELGSLKALTEILIDGTSIRDIPISIGHLVSLETLSASSCVSLTHLPSSITYLTSLSELTLDGAPIHQLPDLIGELKILRKLSLKDCRWMQKLPDSIRKLKDSLIQLDVSGTGISEFPNSIQDLQRLKVLRMNSCFIRVFPKAICYLSRLEEFHASHCRSLESDVPPEIERLRCLKILRLGFSRISSLPLTICNLPRLQNLELDHCNMLSMLPRLPSSLSRLCFSSRRMVKFPNLFDMQNLEELILADSDSMELLNFEGKYFWIPNLPKLKAMQLHHSGIHSIRGGINCPLLRKLTLSCPNLELFYAHLPLLTLSIHHCRSLEILEAVSFQCLVELQVLDSAVRRIRGLRLLKSLRVLNVSNCQVEHLDGLEMLSSLVRLTVSHCEYLRKLPSLSKLVLLRSLAVSYCDSLESLPNLSQLEMLKEVEIHSCKKLSEIHGLEDLKKLQVN